MNSVSLIGPLPLKPENAYRKTKFAVVAHRLGLPEDFKIEASPIDVVSRKTRCGVSSVGKDRMSRKKGCRVSGVGEDAMSRKKGCRVSGG